LPGTPTPNHSVERAARQAQWEARAQKFIQGSRSPRTRHAYATAFADFAAWCDDEKVASVPATPIDVVHYMASLEQSGAKPSTIQQRLAAISDAHRQQRLVSPTKDVQVREAMSGIRRVVDTTPNRKTPLVDAATRTLVDATPMGTLAGLRDKALLLLGRQLGIRRSELVALDVSDLEEHSEGLAVMVRKSKTDQESRGRPILVLREPNPRYCPVRAVRSWLTESGLKAGPLFRPVNRHDLVLDPRMTDRAVALIIKRAASRAGLNPAEYAGHSLRAGLVTSGKENRAPDHVIMANTGHANTRTLDGYARVADLAEQNVGRYTDLSGGRSVSPHTGSDSQPVPSRKTP
jgi:site-specific recombinase XerD